MNDNEKKGSLRTRFLTSFKNSFFIYYLTKFSIFLYNAVLHSIFGFVMTSYDKLSNAFASSFFVVKIREFFSVRGSTVKKIKFKIAKFYENSYLLSKLQHISHNLLLTHVNTVGLFFFSFGFYIVIIQLLKQYTFNIANLNRLSLIAGIVIMVISIPMFFSKKNIANAIYKSRMLHFVLFDFLGLRVINIARAADAESRRGFNIPFILGMVFGVISIFVEPIYIVAAFLLFILANIILSSPEAGVILVLLFLPFLSTMTLAAVLLLIFVSYILKLLCGRRIIKFSLVDFTVLIFLFFTISGGVFSVDSSSFPKMLLYVCFILGYFVVKNTVRSPSLVRRCLYSLTASSVLVSLYGLYQNFFGTPSTVWQDTAMFSEIKGRVVSTFANPNVLGEYIILLFPITLALMITAKRANERFALLLACAANCSCLIFTWSRGAWLGFILSVALFLFLTHRNFFTAGIFCLPLFASLIFIGANTSVVRRFTSIGSVADTSTSYRIGIWRGVLLMLSEVFAFGIGIGEGAFADIYPFYAFSGIETAPHSHNLYLQITVETGIFSLLAFLIFVFIFSQCSLSFCRYAVSKSNKTVCLGIFCGVFAFLVQGMTDYVWYNYRIFLLFWMVVGLGIAHIFTAKNTTEESNEFRY